MRIDENGRVTRDLSADRPEPGAAHRYHRAPHWRPSSLCAVKHRHSNKIVGYSMGSRMKSALAVLNIKRWQTREELRLAIVIWIETKYDRPRPQRARAS